MKKFNKLILTITSILVIVSMALKETHAVTEEAWSEAVTVYGAALESNDSLKQTTYELLGSSDKDKVSYVYAEDLNKYLGLQSSNDVLKSSIRIKKLAQGKGLTLSIDQSKGKITKISAETYKNALLTAGVMDAEVKIAAAEDVTGESALSGVYKAFETQGEPLKANQTQVAQEELNTITTISEENQNQPGFSQEQLNKAIAEAKSAVAQNSGDLSVEQINNIVIEKLNNNGLQDVLNNNQINLIVNFINNAQTQNIFTAENKDKFVDGAKNYINDIKNSDAFKKASDQAKEAGKKVQDTLSDEGFWNKIISALQSIFEAIANFFKSLTN